MGARRAFWVQRNYREKQKMVMMSLFEALDGTGIPINKAYVVYILIGRQNAELTYLYKGSIQQL